MPRRPKQFRYCDAVLVHETYSCDDYDRSYKSYNYNNTNSYGNSNTSVSGFGSVSSGYGGAGSASYSSANLFQWVLRI